MPQREIAFLCPFYNNGGKRNKKRAGLSSSSDRHETLRHLSDSLLRVFLSLDAHILQTYLKEEERKKTWNVFRSNSTARLVTLSFSLSLSLYFSQTFISVPFSLQSLFLPVQICIPVSRLRSSGARRYAGRQKSCELVTSIRVRFFLSPLSFGFTETLNFVWGRCIIHESNIERMREREYNPFRSSTMISGAERIDIAVQYRLLSYYECENEKKEAKFERRTTTDKSVIPESQ